MPTFQPLSVTLRPLHSPTSEPTHTHTDEKGYLTVDLSRASPRSAGDPELSLTGFSSPSSVGASADEELGAVCSDACLDRKFTDER